MKPLTPLVMGLHLRSGAALIFKLTYMETKHSNKYHLEFFATSHGKGTVDRLGGTVKCFVWQFGKAGGNAPLDTISYSEIARQHNPNINIFFMSSEDIVKKSDEMTEHWDQILPVPKSKIALY